MVASDADSSLRSACRLHLVAAGRLDGPRGTRAARVAAPLVWPACAGRTHVDWSGLLDQLAERLGIPPARRRQACTEALAWAHEDLARAAEAGLDVCCLPEMGYPALLREIPDPPLVLWFRGRWPPGPAVAVVGSRNASPESVVVARRLARGLSEAGLCVVSGLARGVDAAAHRGALDGPSPTVAVLGSGPDVIYPRGHRDLADTIAGTGALVSEFAPGTQPVAWHFPVRNRIISGLSRAVVVVEASDRSGSLITAKAALEQGRDVLAVPGGVSAGCHRGCHALIKDGARLVETVSDILEELAWPGAPTGALTIRGKSHGNNSLGAIMAAGTPVDVDALALRTGRPASDLLAELSRLELDGLVARLPGGQFVRLD